MHLNPIFSLNKLRVKTAQDTPTSLTNTNSPYKTPTVNSAQCKQVLHRQNNLALKKSQKPETPLAQLSKPLTRKKSRPKTLSAALNGPVGKICFTDFFSENMKREFVKMGRIDVLATFAMSNNSKPVQQPEPTFSLNLNDVFRNKLLSREGRTREKYEKSEGNRRRSMVGRKDVKSLIGICDDTRVENNKLKKDINKTVVALKDQYLSLLRSSSCKSYWKDV